MVGRGGSRGYLEDTPTTHLDKAVASGARHSLAGVSSSKKHEDHDKMRCDDQFSVEVVQIFISS